jgi:hypothetical protein
VSNYLCNFDTEGKIVYEINSGMPESFRSAEYNFAHIFVAMEELVRVGISDPLLWG